MAQGTDWVPHALTFQEQGLQRNDPPEPTPMYMLDQRAYKCYRHKGTPLYARAGIHVHLVHHLSIQGRLSIYEVVGDGWQLNVINTDVSFGNATEPFLQVLAEASLRAHLDQVLHTVVFPGLTRLNSEGARLNR